MATKWILHTETKGTGAQMVPLDSVAGQRRAAAPVLRRQPRRRQPEASPAVPKPPRRFRIVDVMTRQVLVEDAGTKDAVAALGDVRSLVDVNVYAWEQERGRWRLLTLPEQRAMLELAHELAPEHAPEEAPEEAQAQAQAGA